MKQAERFVSLIKNETTESGTPKANMDGCNWSDVSKSSSNSQGEYILFNDNSVVYTSEGCVIGINI